MIDLAIPEDIVIVNFFIITSLIISILIYIINKNILKSILSFSLINNIVFLLLVLTHSFIFIEYGIQWLQYFSLFIWPIANIYLINKIITKKIL